MDRRVVQVPVVVQSGDGMAAGLSCSAPGQAAFLSLDWSSSSSRMLIKSVPEINAAESK